MSSPKIRWPFGNHKPFEAPSADFGIEPNQTKIDEDGRVFAHGDAVMYKDIVCPIIQRTTGAGRPSLATFVGTIRQYQFDVDDATELEPVEIQHDYEEGTDLEVHVHWATGGLNDTTERGVKWELAYSIAGPGGVFDTVVTESEETIIEADLPDRSLKYTQVAIIPGASVKIGHQLVMQIKRIASTETAPAADPFVLDIGVHYKVNTLGSRTLMAK